MLVRIALGCYYAAASAKLFSCLSVKFKLCVDVADAAAKRSSSSTYVCRIQNNPEFNIYLSQGNTYYNVCSVRNQVLRLKQEDFLTNF